MNEVAKATEMTPAEIDALLEQDAGLGQSTREEDKIQAWVKVLHQLSPELNRNEPTYAGPNAAPGDIWVAAHNLLIPGKDGFEFQQCGYQYSWVEWPGEPGSGGRPVARHPNKPVDMGGEQTAPGKIVLPSGHQIIETRYHMGIVYTKDMKPFPATISYSSTGTRCSTNLTAKLQSKYLASGALAPTYRYLWRMTTFEQHNDRNQHWFLLQAGDGVLATAEQVKVGSEISRKIRDQLLKLGEEEAVNAQVDNIPF